MKKIWLVALICAILAGAATYSFAQNVMVSNDPEKDKEQIVFALDDVPAGTQITSSNIDTYFTIRSVDKASIPTDAVSDVSDILGKTSSGYIYKDEAINMKRFGDKEENNAGLSYNIEDGYVAYSLDTATTMGVDGFILPGDTVDIIALKTGDGDEQSAETVLTDVKILKIGSNDVNVDLSNPIVSYASITVELSPEDAKVMFLVEKSSEYGGVYKLALNHRAAEEKK